MAKDNGTQKQGNQSCQEIHLRLLGKMYSQIEFIGESWRIAESIAKLKEKKHEPTLPIIAHRRIYFHPRDKANVINEFFIKISTLDNKPYLPPHDQCPGPPLCELNNIINTEQEVVEQLQSLINISSGPDVISPRVLRHISCSIKNPHTKLFNLYL